MSVKTELGKFAQDNGLSFDEEAKLVYGRAGGHNVCVYPYDPNVYRLKLSYGIKRGEGGINEAEIKEFVSKTKSVVDYEISGRRVVFEAGGAAGIKKTYAKAKTAMEEIALFLNAKGYIDCCANCGVETGVGTYYINEAGHLMCDDCFKALSENMSQNKQQIAKKKGNVLTGTVGALLGSLIGVVAIVIIGQLGYVAAISGVLMGVCTLKGYELLGGKLDKIGIAISCVFMLLMVYVGNNIDWALVVVDAFEDITILEAFKAIPDLLANEIIPMESYITNIVMVYLFTLLGAFPTVKSAAKSKSGNYVARRAGATV